MAVDICIYLHGFFFTEVQGNNLVIASPRDSMKMHQFGFWDHQQNTLQQFPDTFSWIGQLIQGQKDSFPTDILQFTRKDLGMSEDQVFINPAGNQYAVYVKLPLPTDITSVRPGGNINELGMNMRGKVAKSIIGKCGEKADLSLIVCLRYSSIGQIGFTDISFFAEHCSPPNLDALKVLFKDAGRVFPNFDLEPIGLNDGDPLPGPGDDENQMKLCEAGKKLDNNPCPACTRGIARQSQSREPLLRTANCPQFGITQS